MKQIIQIALGVFFAFLLIAGARAAWHNSHQPPPPKCSRVLTVLTIPESNCTP